MSFKIVCLNVFLNQSWLSLKNYTIIYTIYYFDSQNQEKSSISSVHRSCDQSTILFTWYLFISYLFGSVYNFVCRCTQSLNLRPYINENNEVKERLNQSLIQKPQRFLSQKSCKVLYSSIIHVFIPLSLSAEGNGTPLQNP